MGCSGCILLMLDSHRHHIHLTTLERALLYGCLAVLAALLVWLVWLVVSTRWFTRF